MNPKDAVPRILLVEDDPTSLAFLQAATEALPARVDVARSAAEALALATSARFALWLVDANLSDGTGASLLATLRDRGLATVAVAHTASHDDADHAALRAAGFAATIAKPLGSDAWRAAIRRALGPDDRPDAALDAPMPVRETRALPTWDDPVALAALGGNADNVAALRGLFVAELPMHRDTVGAGFARGDAAAVRAALHKLRAACGFVGAARLGAAAVALQAVPDDAMRLQRFLDAVDATAVSP